MKRKKLTQEEFEKIYDDLAAGQRKVLILFLKGHNIRDIAKSLNCSPDSVRQFMSKVYAKFGLQNEEGEHERLQDYLIDLFKKHKPELVMHRVKKLPLRYPSGIVDLDSPFYIKREPIESECYQKITEQRMVLRIKAASKMGKSSLLKRILFHAKNQSYRTIYINLKYEFEKTQFSDLGTFLRCLCTQVSEQLKLPYQLDTYWLPYRSNILNCTKFFQMLLEQENSPLVLGLDGVEEVFRYPEINQDFFYLLRSWHDKASDPEQKIWKELRQVIVYSSENYGYLDTRRSPFNVGEQFELEEFTQTQMLDLARKYELDWHLNQVNQLMSLIGGDPYLASLAYYYFAKYPEVTLEQFLFQAPTDNEIYREHLRSLLDFLKNEPSLQSAFQEVIKVNESPILEPELEYELYSLRVIKFQKSRVVIRCELYRKYFQEHL